MANHPSVADLILLGLPTPTPGERPGIEALPQADHSILPLPYPHPTYARGMQWPVLLDGAVLLDVWTCTEAVAEMQAVGRHTGLSDRDQVMALACATAFSVPLSTLVSLAEQPDRPANVAWAAALARDMAILTLGDWAEETFLMHVRADQAQHRIADALERDLHATLVGLLFVTLTRPESVARSLMSIWVHDMWSFWRLPEPVWHREQT